MGSNVNKWSRETYGGIGAKFFCDKTMELVEEAKVAGIRRQDMFGWSKKTCQRTLAELRDRGLIKLCGWGGNARWVSTKHYEEALIAAKENKRKRKNLEAARYRARKRLAANAQSRAAPSVFQWAQYL